MIRMMPTQTMQRTLLLAALAGSLGVVTRVPAVAAAPARGEAEYVRDVVGRAAAHVEAGRYEQALAVLDEAERARPLPVFVYVRATVEERRGDCERAIVLYREFLEHEVPQADAEDARQGQARCRRTLGLPSEDSVAVDTPEGDDVDRSAGAQTDRGAGDDGSDEVEPPVSRRWYADPLGGVLMAGGVVGLGVGLGLYGQSRAEARAADDASDLQTFDDRAQRAVRLDRAGIATMAVGGALLVAGAVRYALVGTRDRRRVAIAPAGLRRGGIVQVTARF
jgi:tetratricopeptide (TPR) repeat protein